ncbi:MDP1, partial [Symbiodinium sp. CCMP2456]
MAVASANSQDKVCTSLLNHLGLLKERDSHGGIDPKLLVIHPGSKTVHLNELAQRTGIEFREMLFFDDRAMNVRVAQKLGISAYQVSSLEGLTYKAFAAGLQTWRSDRRSSSALSSWLQPQPKSLPGADVAAAATAPPPLVVDLIDDAVEAESPPELATASGSGSDLAAVT